MPTESKTFDEVFDEEVELPETADDIKDDDDAVEEEVAEQVEEKKEEVVVVEEKKEEPVKEVKADIDWNSLGLEVFAGKTPQEIAEQIKFERKQLGHTTNMIGELRRELTQLKARPLEVEKPKEEKKNILEGIADLDEADTAKFNVLYEKNPIKALLTYGGDTIKQMIAEEVKHVAPKDTSVILEQTKDQLEFQSFLTSTPDISDTDLQQMQIFDDPQYLGEQKRTYSDLYNLSKIWKNRDQRAEKIYSLMKKHPTLSFTEADNLVPKADKPKPVDKEQLVKDVKKLKTTNPSTVNKVADELPSADSYEAAWDV